MREKTTYTVWAINTAGASIDVAGGEEFTSINAAAAAARAEMGSGWKIRVEDNHGAVVKSFTIR
jgi:hypothetical protein